MAIELATTEDMRYATMSGTTHKCAGEPCSYCSFKKDENDAIVGCNACGDFIGGRCNHTVEDEVDGPN
jgi:transcription elongation factor Elf1